MSAVNVNSGTGVSIARVGAGSLAKFIGQRVSFVGTVEKIAAKTVTFASPEGLKVFISYSGTEDLQIGSVYEMIGVVRSASSIEGQLHVLYSSNFDMALDTKLSQYTQGKYAELFA